MYSNRLKCLFFKNIYVKGIWNKKLYTEVLPSGHLTMIFKWMKFYPNDGLKRFEIFNHSIVVCVTIVQYLLLSLFCYGLIML